MWLNIQADFQGFVTMAISETGITETCETKKLSNAFTDGQGNL